MTHTNRQHVFSVKKKGNGFKGIALCLAIMFLVNCGGRAANPVMVQQYGDEKKACEHLKNNLIFIEKELGRLIPKTKKTGKNVALGVAGILFIGIPWFFIDMSKAEKAEVNAFRQRYNHLLVIAAKKDCGFDTEPIPAFDKKPADESSQVAKATTAKKEDAITKHVGTGFIFSSNGFLITNYHVVKGAKNTKVRTSDGEELEAELISKDTQNDIAILKLNSVPVDIQANMFFGDSSKMKAGDKVFTIGYPLSNILGQKPRYTEGVINSLYGVQDDPRLFQISVPIQPGNSGGPLFNEKGEIIGIVMSSLDSKNTEFVVGAVPQNVNFAIKSVYIRNLLSMLPDLGSALVMPTDLSFVKGESKNFIERAKSNIVLIETDK